MISEDDLSSLVVFLVCNKILFLTDLLIMHNIKSEKYLTLKHKEN